MNPTNEITIEVEGRKREVDGSVSRKLEWPLGKGLIQTPVINLTTWTDISRYYGFDQKFWVKYPTQCLTIQSKIAIHVFRKLWKNSSCASTLMSSKNAGIQCWILGLSSRIPESQLCCFGWCSWDVGVLFFPMGTFNYRKKKYNLAFWWQNPGIKLCIWWIFVVYKHQNKKSIKWTNKISEARSWLVLKTSHKPTKFEILKSSPIMVRTYFLRSTVGTFQSMTLDSLQISITT